MLPESQIDPVLLALRPHAEMAGSSISHDVALRTSTPTLEPNTALATTNKIRQGACTLTSTISRLQPACNEHGERVTREEFSSSL